MEACLSSALLSWYAFCNPTREACLSSALISCDVFCKPMGACLAPFLSCDVFLQTYGGLFGTCSLSCGVFCNPVEACLSSALSLPLGRCKKNGKKQHIWWWEVTRRPRRLRAVSVYIRVDAYFVRDGRRCPNGDLFSPHIFAGFDLCMVSFDSTKLNSVWS